MKPFTTLRAALPGLLASACVFTAFSQAAATDTLASVPGFAPAFTISETVTDSIKTTTEPSGEPGIPPFVMREVVTTSRSTIAITANISGIDLTKLDPTTPYEISVGGLSLAGTLGDDPTYTDVTKATKKSVFIAFGTDINTGEPKKSGNGLRLTWTATRLTVNISRASTDDLDPGSAFADGLAGVANSKVRDILPVTVNFSDQEGLVGSQPRTAYLQGSSTVSRRVFGSEAAGTFEELFLNSVSITGSFDLAMPTVTVTTPKSPYTMPTSGGTVTIAGKASDANDLERVEYTTAGDMADVAGLWTMVTNVGEPVPPLPEGQTYGPENVTYEFQIPNIPVGTTHVWIRAVDASGNYSKTAVVTLVDPIPMVFVGRWDALVSAQGEGDVGVPGFLTFTCDSKGGLSGKLTLEGTAAPYSFTGAWSGTGINAAIKRTGLPTLFLSGSAAPPSPATLGEAALACTLKLASAPGDPDIVFGTASAFRCPWDAKNKIPTGKLGVGRFHFAHQPAAAAPVGHGYFSAVVSNVGAVVIAGRTGDGTIFTASPVLGAQGQIPVYASLYGNKGSFSTLQRVDIDTGAVLGIDIPCLWNRPPNFTDKQFPAGFSVSPLTLGSRYTPPAKDVRILGLTSDDAEGIYFGEGVDPEVVQNLKITTANKISAVGGTSAFASTVTTTTGAVTGAFNMPGSTVKAQINALIVGNRAYGHYIAPALKGSLAKRHGRVMYTEPR